MNKFFAIVVLTMVLVFFMGMAIPYWALMLFVAAMAFVLKFKPVLAFFGCGFGFGLAWTIVSYVILVKTGSLLPAQMAVLMGLPNEFLLFLATGILGFVIGSFSGLTGALFKNVINKKRDVYIYRR